MVLSNAQWFANPGVVYEIDESCRINDDDSAYLYRTPSEASNLRTWTASMWVKRGNLGDSTQNIFFAASEPGVTTGIGTQDAGDYDRLFISMNAVSGITSQVFRDPAAWFHLHWAMDTTQSTDSNRMKLSINGVLVTAFDSITYPSQDTDLTVNKTQFHGWGRNSAGGNQYYDGYLSECYLIDGIVTTPADFGEVSSTTGQWIPKAYSGSFGTNGFHLDFADSSDLGNDVSGNGNDFTSSGLAAADQMTDTPTDNFCTLNSIDKATQVTLADGNLQYGLSANTYTAVRGTIGLTSGKWYWELTAVAGMGANTLYAGIATNASALQVSNAPTDGTAYVFISYTGNKAYTTNVSYGSAWNTNGKVIGVALDLDAGKIWWSIDDTWQDSGDPAAGSDEAYSSITGEWFPYIVFNDSGPNVLFNFGQSAFSGTQPSGFNAISTANIDDPTIADPSAYFQTTLYTGDGASSLAVNQGGNSTFEPDFVWIKNRDASDNQCLFDAVRGATKLLSSNNTDAESTDTDTLTAFDSDGFTVGDDVKVNTSSEKYVGWQWLEDATAGFDIVSYTGTGSARTVSHNLGVKPDMMIFKRRDGTQNWGVYHTAITADNVLVLDLTNVVLDDAAVFNDTEPTSSVFTVNTDGKVNASTQTYVGWLFAGVDGFSKFGSYTGNGAADGPFVWCGFKPAFILKKNTNSADDWVMWDNQRSLYNVSGIVLKPNLSDAEIDSSTKYIDLLSNGFKIRASDSSINGSGNKHVFMAFAESPFKTATAR